MPNVNMPLSGAVSQWIEAWSSLFTAFGSQFGLININVGASSDPQLESKITGDVASYGSQLGRVEDALIVLIEHAKLNEKELPRDQRRAIEDLRSMLNGIADAKEKSGSKHVLRP
jgi:hypothetical protein